MADFASTRSLQPVPVSDDSPNMSMPGQNFLHGLPSPTLTNPDLLLPEDAVGTYSPTLHERPPSPSRFLLQFNPIKLADAPSGRRTSSPLHRTLTPVSTANSSHSAPPRVDESPACGNSRRSLDVLVTVSSVRSNSSQSNLGVHKGAHDTPRSNSSISVRSQEPNIMQAAAKFPGDSFSLKPHEDVHVQISQEPEAGYALEDMEEQDDELEDKLAELPRPAALAEALGSDKWLEDQEDGDDMSSHAALSKRAEMILANAKKRLNVMEGNLRGARSSLLVPSQALSNLKMQSELSAQIHAARERDRRLYGGIGHIPPRAYDNSPLTNLNSGHSRGLSETFTPSSLPAGAVKKIHYSQKRASSALGPIRGQWSPSEGGSPFTRTPSIKSSRSQEQMRQERLSTWQNATDAAHAARRVSPDPRRSPTTNLDPLPEEEATPSPAPQRPPSSASDLRTQMNELKGRISSLKERAKEEGMRRRSLQSLRAPSPFTAAENWYSGADSHQNGSPISADAGVGTKRESAQNNERSRSQISHDQEDSTSSHRSASEPEVREERSSKSSKRSSIYSKHSSLHSSSDGVTNAHDMHNGHDADVDDEEDAYMQTQQHGHLIESYEVDADGESHSRMDEFDETEEYPDPDHHLERSRPEGEDDSSNAESESIYEDAEWEPVSERHEDRVDAFDYENFFLHSAMGSYLADRRDSVSSDGSVETTRPSPRRSASAATESRTPKEKRLMHYRNASADSISTVQSFDTATEGARTPAPEYPDDGEDYDQVGSRLTHQSSYQLLVPINHPLPQRASSLNPLKNGNNRSDSAVHINSKSVPETLVAILAARTQSQHGPSTLDDQDMDLIQSLAESLDAVCRGLQSTDVSSYDRRLWRRRLDDARRMLDGDGEGEAF